MDSTEFDFEAYLADVMRPQEETGPIYVDLVLVFKRLEQDRTDGTLRDKIATKFPLYGSSKLHPGYIERELEDCEVEHGLFRDGNFIAISCSNSDLI